MDGVEKENEEVVVAAGGRPVAGGGPKLNDEVDLDGVDGAAFGAPGVLKTVFLPHVIVMVDDFCACLAGVPGTDSCD